MINKSLKDGRKILEFLNSLNIPVFVLPGNWDWTGGKDKWTFANQNFWKKKLIKRLKNLKDCHKKTRTFKEIKIIGHGITGSPEYPTKERAKHFTKNEIEKKKKLFKQMSKKFSKAKNPILFLSHNVPYNTKLDMINNPSSPMHGKHMGSYLARELISKYSPLVCIGGHMHENFGRTRLKKTTCINSGFGSHVNTLLEIKDGKIKKIEFNEKGKIIS